ncbi:MAG: thioredoxin domain-containing protein [Gammaproteobacteria bacterium]|nr:thioredoxin domain-containing protein [Gammaproteobacteria bacterium]
MHRNRLHSETSPYLLQHAGNPVDWLPWGEEALAAARAANKPILLSVGYSACHWCHVMAHESFEDPATAATMNSLFVNIKVDREERPDIDKVYQIAHALITRAPGGWPLTMFLTPDGQQPFFGGTYFPKDASHGLPAFRDLLVRVAAYYSAHRAEIDAQTEPLRAAFDAVSPPGEPAGAALDAGPLDGARAALARSFDREWGGFGLAPKFPHAASIERCLRQWRATSESAAPDLDALYMATLSLTRMAEGGIYDQLGGGFFRYSVDREWSIPHFEKMLYDNGTLLALYAEAHLATGEALFGRVAAETADWALREMRSADGAFHASLDADSPGGEGAFYVWDRAAVESALDADEFAAFAARFGLTRAANFEGRWHLRVVEAAADDAAERTIDAARARLLAVRDARPRPGVDTKILTAWNALMIKGLAVAARALARPDLADAAVAAADFIAERLWRDGRLLAVHAGGRARFPAYLDDYAFMADALLELLQTRWRSRDWDLLTRLADVLLSHFEDPEVGGFYFTASDHEQLLHRGKPFGDESLPAGNGVAAQVLTKLGYLAAEPRYLHAAQRTLIASFALMSAQPQAHMSLVNALDVHLDPPRVVIVRGPADEAAAWSAELSRLYAPSRLVISIPDDAAGLPPVFSGCAGGDGAVAYVCTGMTCSAPIRDFGELVRVLRDGG